MVRVYVQLIRQPLNRPIDLIISNCIMYYYISSITINPYNSNIINNNHDID